MFVYVAGAGLVLLSVLFFLSIIGISMSVKKQCRLAQDRYGGGCVEALVAHLEDEDNDYYSRNSAIWALGQLGDERSLPILESYYTGYNGEQPKLDQELSQFELKRAIGYMHGNFNIVKFLGFYCSVY